MPAIRQRANALAGRVLTATLTAPVSTFTAPGPVVVGGALTAGDGSPIAGASVVVQSRALAGSSAVAVESDVAPLTTDADGRYSVSLPVRFNAALRVLFAGAAGLSATVSEP